MPFKEGHQPFTFAVFFVTVMTEAMGSHPLLWFEENCIFATFRRKLQRYRAVGVTEQS